VPGYRLATFLFTLCLSSAMASVAVTGLLESMNIGMTFYGCADADGAIVLDSLQEGAMPVCRREEVLVSWRTDEAALHRM
jgi:hypothetical protein